MSGRSFEDIVRGCGGSEADLEFFSQDPYESNDQVAPVHYYDDYDHGQYMQPTHAPVYEYDDIEQGAYAYLTRNDSIVRTNTST